MSLCRHARLHLCRNKKFPSYMSPALQQFHLLRQYAVKAEDAVKAQDEKSSTPAPSSMPAQSSTPPQSSTPAPPWHVWDPKRLAILSTVGNMCALCGAASADHAVLRTLLICQSSCVASFNFLLPKPLKPHQWTAGGWGVVFGLLHCFNLSMILHYRYGHVTFTEEEYQIYEEGFHVHGMTPKQFQRLLAAGAQFRSLQSDEVIATIEDEIKEAVYITKGEVVCERPGLTHNVTAGKFLGKMRPHSWRERTSKERQQQVDEQRAAREEASGKHFRLFRKLSTVGKGEKWQNSLRAGPEGCSLIVWPIDSFISTVASDAELTSAMSSVAFDNLAEKLESSSVQADLKTYHEMLEMALCDGLVNPLEKRLLRHYRAEHGIPNDTHEEYLREMGWTAQCYDDGVKASRSRSNKGDFL